MNNKDWLRQQGDDRVNEKKKARLYSCATEIERLQSELEEAKQECSTVFDDWFVLMEKHRLLGQERDELTAYVEEALHTLGDPDQWDGVQWVTIRAMIVEGRELLQTNKEQG